MPKKKLPESTAPRADAATVRALAEAVQHEIRFGARAECRPELDARWALVIDMLRAK